MILQTSELHTASRIQPIAGLHLAAAAQTEQNRIGHIFFRKADLRGFGSVDGKFQLRLICRLMDAHVDGAGNLANLLCQMRSQLAVARLIAARDSLRILAKYPWIGTGMGSFLLTCMSR